MASFVEFPVQQISESMLERLLAVAMEFEAMHGRSFAESFLHDVRVAFIEIGGTHRITRARSPLVSSRGAADRPWHRVHWSTAECFWRGR